MTRFRKKLVVSEVIEAAQWFKNGDHPLDVGMLRSRPVYESMRCDFCQEVFSKHGWIHVLKGGHIVCPGDWIITDVAAEEYCPCKPVFFEQTYEPVEEDFEAPRKDEMKATTMNLYLVSQDENNDFDTYDEMVVAAESEEEARNTFPCPGGEWGRKYSTWASSPDFVTVQLIGVAVPGREPGVVITSFNAG